MSRTLCCRCQGFLKNHDIKVIDHIKIHPKSLIQNFRSEFNFGVRKCKSIYIMALSAFTFLAFFMHIPIILIENIIFVTTKSLLDIIQGMSRLDTDEIIYALVIPV